jgi:hypothetical protein
MEFYCLLFFSFIDGFIFKFWKYKVILSAGFILIYSRSLGEAILNHSNPIVPHTPVGGSGNFIFRFWKDIVV